MNYYTDNNPHCTAWMEQLILERAIPPGRVHCADIRDAEPKDAVHAHFFAGIAGWAKALDLIGWSATVPVWTASLPCQPFSSAGQQQGFQDDRHLWPAFRDLINVHRPPVIFGEQTQSELGRDWLVVVQSDLAALGYASAAADLCAASVGAPHRRQRLYWVAYAPGRWERSDREEVQRSTRGCRRLNAPWARPELRLCADAKTRPIEPETQPLVNGVPSDLALIGGAGNAIVPQVAALFIKSFLEAV